jgi:hypothetical protein
MMSLMAMSFSKDKWRWLFRVLGHPMEAFFEIRHREAGSAAIGVLMMVAFGLTYSINRLFASIVVSDVEPRSVNLIAECAGVVALFILFCVANWSITCLMEGEGRFLDIVTVVGYSLLPLTLAWLPATILSHAVAADEEAFYEIVKWAGAIWSCVLMLSGIMVAHGYSLAKTLATMLLTAVSMLIIIFVALMLVNLLNQVYTFFYSIYTELVLRS